MKLQPGSQMYEINPQDLFMPAHHGTLSQLQETLTKGFVPHGRNDIPAWSYDIPIDWGANPFSDRNWQFQLHAWYLLRPHLALLKIGDDPLILQSMLAVALDWHAFHLKTGSVTEFSWEDMAVGRRAEIIAFLWSMAVRGKLTASADESERLRELWHSHLDFLTEHSHYTMTNHGFAQIHGLRALCRPFPDDPKAMEGMAFSSDKLNQLLDSQFDPEGAHKEHSPEYHYYALGIIKRMLRTGWYSDISKLCALVGSAQEVASWLLMPDGRCIPVGDTSPIGPSKRDDAGSSGDQSVARKFEIGYGLVRGGPGVQSDRQHLLFFMGAFHSFAHKHADDLSVVWYDRGTDILIDPGKYSYNLDEWREYFRSTRGHNTIEIDGKDFPRATKYAYGSALRRVDKCVFGYALDGHVAHTNLGVTHTRLLLYSPNEWLVVIDRLLSSERHGYVQWFHFAPGFGLAGAGERHTATTERVRISVASAATQPVSSEVVTGAVRPRIQGWCSKGYGERTPCATLGISAHGANVDVASAFSLRYEDVTVRFLDDSMLQVTLGPSELLIPLGDIAGTRLLDRAESPLCAPQQSRRLRINSCPVCGDPLDRLKERESCPACGARGRTRSLGPLLGVVIAPLMSNSPIVSKPLLAFAMVRAEGEQLSSVFEHLKSVSLFGSYGTDHETGVDIRDLSRFGDGQAAGVFGSLIFDYFTEHEKALSECFRVIATGGIFFTHIASYRLLNDDEPPALNSVIKGRSGYFEYLPDEGIPSVKVGRNWFRKALRGAGFSDEHVVIQDPASGQDFDWFVGRKLPSPDTPVAKSMIVNPSGSAAASSPAAMYPSPATIRTNATPAFAATYSAPVDPAFGFKRVTIELSVPALPSIAADVGFSEQVYDRVARVAKDTVIGCQAGGVAVSDDLGKNWEYVPLPDAAKASLWNSFTLQDGSHLVQARPPRSPSVGSRAKGAPLFSFDRNWHFRATINPGRNPWHGTNSIDEANGTVIYGEYPANTAGPRNESDPTKIKQYEESNLVAASNLFRSYDQGRSWHSVFRKHWREIRHFHTVISDPYQPSRWWASSGDNPRECHIWSSADDGTTWREATDPVPDVTLHPAHQDIRAQSVHRHTAVVVCEDHLLWGVDDWLGTPQDFFDDTIPIARRVGARLAVSPKSVPLKPRLVGFTGDPIRSIVDVGEAYIVITEAKRPTIGLCPRVFVCSKTEPVRVQQLFTVSNFIARETGFTYSRASIAAKDGTFFSYRSSTDAFPAGVRILRWQVSFD